MPNAIRTSGYMRLAMQKLQGAVAVSLKARRVVLEITKLAQVDYANEPNKSALMPATSPTLSPTLSAIVAGFFGLSYGNPDYTLPIHIMHLFTY